LIISISPEGPDDNPVRIFFPLANHYKSNKFFIEEAVFIQ